MNLPVPQPPERVQPVSPASQSVYRKLPPFMEIGSWTVPFVLSIDYIQMNQIVIKIHANRLSEHHLCVFECFCFALPRHDLYNQQALSHLSHSMNQINILHGLSVYSQHCVIGSTFSQ